jgi:hypothetical protein
MPYAPKWGPHTLDLSHIIRGEENKEINNKGMNMNGNK